MDPPLAIHSPRESLHWNETDRQLLPFPHSQINANAVTNSSSAEEPADLFLFNQTNQNMDSEYYGYRYPLQDYALSQHQYTLSRLILAPLDTVTHSNPAQQQLPTPTFTPLTTEATHDLISPRNEPTKSEVLADPSPIPAKRHQCPHCPYSCDHHSRLQRHIQQHSSLKPFHCTLCPYTTNRASSLKRHHLTHTREKHFQCFECDFATPYLCDLTCHMRRHTGEKPYKCDQCEYASAYPSAIKRHLRKHTGEKPYACKECDDEFVHSNTLLLHMVRAHGAEMFVCRVCKFESIYKNTVTRHEEGTHSEEVAAVVAVGGFGDAGKPDTES
ncbi:hypothetical protein HDU98_009338 [Podochytrium sp. JEL0797]|nr:hypothetical protein HDU98_009338 [Podochytrium sp. JEL0797]